MSGFSREETLSYRKKYIGAACSLWFKENPLKIVRAEGQYMYDEEGQAYLDCINNVCHVGHSHPKVVEAATAQMKVLNTNTRFLHDNLLQLAKRLTDSMPEKLSVCYFCNSGSEANDLAIRLARRYTGNKDVVVLDNAYHGHTDLLINISPYKFKKPSMPPQKKWVHVVEPPDLYRGRYAEDPSAGEKYAFLVKNKLESINHNGRKICAFILESLQSCGGQHTYPPDYMKRVFKYVREAGGVCIADEVQTGFGRVGSEMWAFQLQGPDAVPDIVTMGKPMGNGHPISAVITTREISNQLGRGGHEYFNTFGGNPVSCAVGLKVLDIIEEENLKENALNVGNLLMELLKDLQQRHEIIGHVRGVGLFVGVELVKDRSTKVPASDEALWISHRLREKFILLSTEGQYGNVLKFKPPMCFTEDNARQLTKALDEVMTDLKTTTQANPNFNIHGNHYAKEGANSNCNNSKLHNGLNHSNGAHGESNKWAKGLSYNGADDVVVNVHS